MHLVINVTLICCVPLWLVMHLMEQEQPCTLLLWHCAITVLLGLSSMTTCLSTPAGLSTGISPETDGICTQAACYQGCIAHWGPDHSAQPAHGAGQHLQCMEAAGWHLSPGGAPLPSLPAGHPAMGLGPVAHPACHPGPAPCPLHTTSATHLQLSLHLVLLSTLQWLLPICVGCNDMMRLCKPASLPAVYHRSAAGGL